MIYIRIRRPGLVEVLLKAPDEKLQAVLDRAWESFGTPGMKMPEIPVARVEPQPTPKRRRR